MSSNQTERPFTVAQLARYLGVTSAWLRAEADGGRLPHVRTDTGMLFDRETVERILAERAKSEGVRNG